MCIAHLSKEEFYKLRRNSDNVKNMFGNNEIVETITHYEEFDPKSTEEASVARIRARLNTPPRSTREPWGNPGFFPVMRHVGKLGAIVSKLALDKSNSCYMKN